MAADRYLTSGVHCPPSLARLLGRAVWPQGAVFRIFVSSCLRVALVAVFFIFFPKQPLHATTPSGKHGPTCKNVFPRQDEHLGITQPKLGTDDCESPKKPVALVLRYCLSICSDIQWPD